MDGAPNRLIRRYVTAPLLTAGEAPKTRTISGASGQPSASTITPIAAASQIPSMPSLIASRRRPAPSWRATAAVVP